MADNDDIGGWIAALFRRWFPINPEISALIASKVEIDQALSMATEGERVWVTAGFASRSVIDQIGAAALVREILSKVMDHAELVRYVQHLQNRYKTAVGPTTFDRYKDDLPKDVWTDQDKLRAELKTLSYRLRLTYATSYKRDYYLAKIRSLCFETLAVSMALAVGIVLFEQWRGHAFPVLNFTVVALLGLGGALTSISRRAGTVLMAAPLTEDPIVEASALDQGSASLWVAALSGPVFALILTIIFMAAASDFGGLAPLFVPTCPKGCPPLSDFHLFCFDFYLKDGAAAARLVLWSFVAGFAERLVPDVLDRISKTVDK